jgi:glycosyltransferase involved in cell wall biosynthesis
MRVLYWTDFFLPHIGGIETFGGDLIPALQARGHEVTVLTSSHKAGLPAVEQVGSIPVHRFQAMYDSLFRVHGIDSGLIASKLPRDTLASYSASRYVEIR